MSIGASQVEFRTISSRSGASSRMRVACSKKVCAFASTSSLREPGPGDRLARRVADHRGEVADDQHRDVAEVLEQPQPAQHHGEAEVEVGGGRVDAELDPQRAAGRELLAQLVVGDDVDGAGGEQLHLAVDVHDGRR